MGEFTVLCVCTGNICRSPVAELLLGRALAASGVRVTSAGTAAPPGVPISPEMDALLRDRGVDASGHRARPLTERDVQGADLVIGMTRQHRSRAIELAPAALRRSFTLLGLATIAREVSRTDPEALTGGPADRLRALVQLAPRHRALDGNDIDDPIGRDAATYARVFAEIEEAVAAVATVVSREL